MTVFKDYAGYYDAIYKEKDYAQECDFVESIFKRRPNGAIETVLDLGCGTGGHSLILAARGYQVVGVDLSEPMLAKAKAKAQAEEIGVDFVAADIRELSLGRQFDAVISMFAVMSYQTANDDFEAALRAARKHLKPQGLFVFDVWSGPAVLTEKPADRVKTLEVDGGTVLRIAQPVMDIVNHTVQVNYRLIHLKGDQVVAETSESHLMRYFFPQEIAYFLAKSGFETVSITPFGSVDAAVSEKDWNVTVVARAADGRGGDEA